MIRDGKPYIPPGCPIFRDGGEFDITPDKFSMAVYDYDNDPSGHPTKTEISGVFLNETSADVELPPTIATDRAVVPVDSPDAAMAHWINPRGFLRSNERLGKIFCDRIMNCHGIRENDECWALGRQGVKAALRQYDEEAVS